jgi:hypothetical protein
MMATNTTSSIHKEKANGSSVPSLDGLVRVDSYHPTTTSSLLLPPRIPIPRLFSRSSISTRSQQQGSYHNNSVATDQRPSLLRHRSSDSNPSDCRPVTQGERSSSTSTSSASASSSTSAGGLYVVHPSTLSYDTESDSPSHNNPSQQQQQQEQQSRNPSNSIGSNEERESRCNQKEKPSPPQELYHSARVVVTTTTKTTPRNTSRMRPSHETEGQEREEKKTMEDYHDTNGTPLKTPSATSYRPRGSIRDVTHSWDMDIPNFPILEIQRIKDKANRLRTNRDGNSSSSHNQYDPNHITDNYTTTAVDDTNSDANTLPSMNMGQSARQTSRGATTPTPITNYTTYHQHWTKLSHVNQSKNHSGMSHGGSKDSLSEMLGPTPSKTSNYKGGKSPTPWIVDDNQSNSTGPNPFLSPAAIQAEHRLRQDFQKARDMAPVNTSTETDNSHNSQNFEAEGEPNLILHDLCGEAVSTDDIAWRNALSVLATQPELAAIVDPTPSWTPLHISCLGLAPPPTFIVRALLYVYPKAAYIPDDGGRLTLHLVAASSADVDIMQMIVHENPAALYHRDDHGLTPLHLYIRNRSVTLTLERIKILLGCTIPDHRADPVKRRVLQRRGDHLHMSVQSVDQWIKQRKSRPITNLNHNTMVHEQFFDTYPIDVQISLRQLSQWKHSQRNNPLEEVESVEVELLHTEHNDSRSNEDEEDNNKYVIDSTNPAAIPLPKAIQYPIHMVVQRMIIEEAFLPFDPSNTVNVNSKDDNQVPSARTKNSRTFKQGDDDGSIDDEEEVNASFGPISPSPNETSSILRLFVASFPEALNIRDKNGQTPLLQVMQIRDSFPSVDIVEVLIGKRSATGFEALPSWAHNLPTHAVISSRFASDERYMNPAMIPVIETGQLPLHIAAEEAPTDSALIETIHQCYPAAVLVQDGRGRTPLHLSFHNYRRIAPDPNVIEALYTDRVANIVDDYGKIPFDLLIENAHLLPWQKARTNDDRSPSIYRKLVAASILGAAHPNTSAQKRNFLPRIRTLPSWLRVEACSTTFVQDLIVEELVSPWKCAAILLDGVLLITLITVFRLQMKMFVDQLRDDSLIAAWYTYAVYGTAVGRFMARILFGYFATSIGEFRHLCLFNLWYWIDVLAMLMSIVTSIVLYGNASDERLLLLGTATTILLWFSLVGYLSSWWYNMAIFTGGFLKVGRKSCYLFAILAIFSCFVQ